MTDLSSATPLTHAAVAVMARERLLQIRDALKAKIDAAPAAATDLEKKVHYLASQAFAMTNAVPAPPAAHFPGAASVRPGSTTSQHFLLGTLGPSLPAFAALFADGQSWLVDTLHKGTPDEHRERVLARSATFAFTLWERAQPLIAASDASADVKSLRRSQVRAYVLGHLCSIASEVLASPYLDDVQWHPSTAAHPTLTLDEVAAKLEDEVKKTVLRPSIRSRDPELASWWPPAGQVPPELFPAYAAAVQEVYLREGRPRGLAEFEERFAGYPALPEVSADLVADAYRAFRSILATGYEWTFWKWFGVLTPAFAPMLLTVPLMAVLPEGKKIHTGASSEKAWFEAIGLQYSATAIVPLAYSLFIAALSSKGWDAGTIVGLILGLLLLAPAIAYFVSLDEDFKPEVRWVALLAAPLLAELIYVLYLFIARGGGEKLNRLLGWSFILHGLTTLIGTGFIAIPPFAEWLQKGPGEGEWWGAMALLSALVFGVWCLFSWILSRRIGAPVPTDDLPVAQRHFVRLFDDSSLFQELEVADPDLGQLLFPSGRRKLLALWQPGGNLWVRSRGDRIEFSNDGTNVHTTVLAPLAPTTLSELADYLPRAVAGLGVKVLYPSDGGYTLPPGEAFDDHTDFRQLGTEEADDAYVLHHAPKALQALRFSSRGPVVAADRSATVTGAGTIATDPAPTVAGANGVLGDAATRFWTFFRVGDVLRISGNPGRVVTAVDSDQQLRTVLPLPGLPAVGAAGVAYERVADDRTADTAALGQLSISPLFPPPTAFQPTTILNWVSGPQFGERFLPGDVLRIVPGGGLEPQERTVARLISPTQLEVDMPFTAAVGSGSLSYLRVGTEDRDGYRFVGGPEIDPVHGTTIMDHAADLAALLCLGGASRLLDPQQRRPGSPGYPGPGELTRVVQVFRDWNLDRRRLNEWRMLVAGGAVSEKRGRPAEADADPAMLHPDPGWSFTSPTGERISRQVGWVPLLRRWLEMARRPEQKANAETTFRPGDPTNLELSRAMAFLLDLPEPPAAP